MKLSRRPARCLAAGLLFLGSWTLLAAAPALAIPPKPVTYRVNPGDTLYKIAQKFATTVDVLKTANSLPADWIVPGEVFIVPNQNSNRYVVRPGDYLYAIARKFQVTVSDLMAENRLPSTQLQPGQPLQIPEKPAQIGAEQSIRSYLAANNLNALSNLEIVIHKNSHTLSLYQENNHLKSYAVALGDGGPDAKRVAGDHKTPEGYYYIVQKQLLNPADTFLGTRWLRLGYPNANDAVWGAQQSLLNQSQYEDIITVFGNQATPPQNTALGGGVGIHGGSGGDNSGDWTWGCIGLANQDIEDFYDYVPLGAAVLIVK